MWSLGVVLTGDACVCAAAASGSTSKSGRGSDRTVCLASKRGAGRACAHAVGGAAAAAAKMSAVITAAVRGRAYIIRLQSGTNRPRKNLQGHHRKPSGTARGRIQHSSVESTGPTGLARRSSRPVRVTSQNFPQAVILAGVGVFGAVA